MLRSLENKKRKNTKPNHREQMSMQHCCVIFYVAQCFSTLRTLRETQTSWERLKHRMREEKPKSRAFPWKTLFSYQNQLRNLKSLNISPAVYFSQCRMKLSVQSREREKERGNFILDCEPSDLTLSTHWRINKKFRLLTLEMVFCLFSRGGFFWKQTNERNV